MLRGRHGYCCRKLVQNLRGKVVQLWVGLAVFGVLFIALQISGVLQLNRCDQELKRLLLNHISGIQNAILTQQRSPLGLLQYDGEQGTSQKPTFVPHSSKDPVSLMELKQEFIMSNLLVKNPELHDVPEKAGELVKSKEEWILHMDNVFPVTAKGYTMEGLQGESKRMFGVTEKTEKIREQNFVELNQILPSKKRGQPAKDERLVWLSSPNRQLITYKKDTGKTSIPTHKTTKRKIAMNVSKSNHIVTLREADEQKSRIDVAAVDGLGKAKVTESPSSNMLRSSVSMSCKPVTNIVFLKIHKSASSTVMNILFRFGEAHNLTFALPRGSASQLFYPRYFIAPFVEGFSNSKPNQFNILCHHMRFLLPEVEKVMPFHAFYFAILRNPVHLMESSFAYYKASSAFNKPRTLEDFLTEPSRFYNQSASDSHYAKNLMTFDFGFNNNGNSSSLYSRLNIVAIESLFNLVLIAEYFDESMILLKDTLCWNMDDVVSFTLNSRDDKTRLPLSENAREQIKNWNKLDWELYDYFNTTFWNKIDKGIGSERMKQQVSELRQKREELGKTCLQGGSKVDPKSIKDKSMVPLQYGRAKIQGYNLKVGLSEEKREQCESLIRPELQYSSLLYKKQFPERAKALENIKRAYRQQPNVNASNRGMNRNERFQRGVS
ncbi:galactose-3-O-sulfotransferase 2-like [Ambystoma mexicanum]|uniref:galactose-3-O-sulfotransferase 2-like n=1 Tax=Ambystoma mexicanum TaxID=8296 RepID=UPI0037E95FAE